MAIPWHRPEVRIATIEQPRAVDPAAVLDAVCEHFGVEPEHVKSPSRVMKVTEPRRVACYLLRKLTAMTFEDIGTFLGNRDHSTVYWNIGKCKQQLEADHHLADRVALIEASICWTGDGRERLRERILRNVSTIPDTGCWMWMRHVGSTGYGIVQLTYRTMQAHRASYMAFNGPIPEGKQVDHLCRNRWCVNPDHLEAVTPRENVLRGDTIVAENAAKTHCPRGHPLSGENLYEPPGGGRSCKVCARAATRAWIRRRKRAEEIEEENDG